MRRRKQLTVAAVNAALDARFGVGCFAIRIVKHWDGQRVQVEGTQMPEPYVTGMRSAAGFAFADAWVGWIGNKFIGGAQRPDALAKLPAEKIS